MKRTFLRNCTLVLSAVFFLSFVISCEEDFTDIRTNIVGNNDFTTNDTTFAVSMSSRDIGSVRADALELQGVLGQYLLGVYNNQDYEKIEASIITQLDIPINLGFDDFPYPPDSTDYYSVFTIDTAYIKLPYQASFQGNSGAGPLFNLDSIIGNQDVAFTLNVYRLSSFLNELDPTDPTQRNSFDSDATYEVFPEPLNVVANYQLKPQSQDTVQFVLRRGISQAIYDTDSISLTGSNPFIAIPVKKNLIKQEFIDNYENAEFDSQDAFNNFFRGLLIEATGDDGSLISFNFNTTTFDLVPSLEVFYTRTVFRNGSNIAVDTIPLNDSFQFGGIRNSQYKMSPATALASNQARVQGTAGSYARLNILGDDNDLNGVPDQLEFLRSQNWLINDARITVFVDQNTVGTDTLTTPFRMFLFKDGGTLNAPNQSQILDATTEGTAAIDGRLRIDDDRKPDYYVFNITDYISELTAGELDYLPTLGLKVLNPTDLPTTLLDTIIRNYNWNPKGVMLLNELESNIARRPQLKISYSKKIEDN